MLHCDEGMHSLFLKIISWSAIGAVLFFSLRLLGTDPTTFVVLSYLVLGGAWMYQRDRMRYYYLDKIEVVEKERDTLQRKNRELSVELERSRDEANRLKRDSGAEDTEDIEEILYED